MPAGSRKRRRGARFCPAPGEPRDSTLTRVELPGLSAIPIFGRLISGFCRTVMSRRRQIYEGRAKVLFEGPEPGTIVQYFKDDASAFNNQKRGTITGKGVLNNRISEFLMLKLAEIGVPTHLVHRLNM